MKSKLKQLLPAFLLIMTVGVVLYSCKKDEDKKDDQKYILELDTTGKVVSAVMPIEVNHNGVNKLVITQQGDYLTLKDSILTMYSSADPEKPYRTLKKGI